MNEFETIESGKGLLKDQYNENTVIADALKTKRKKSFEKFKNDPKGESDDELD